MKRDENLITAKRTVLQCRVLKAGKIIITAYNPKAKVQTFTKYNVMHRLEQSKDKWQQIQNCLLE